MGGSKKIIANTCDLSEKSVQLIWHWGWRESYPSSLVFVGIFMRGFVDG